MEDRRIPNREVLRLLRGQGKVAWSSLAIRALMISATLVYLLASTEGAVKDALSAMLRISQAHPEAYPGAPTLLWEAVRGVAAVVIMTSVIVVGVGVVAVLIQTRLMFSARLMIPSLQRAKASRPRSSLLVVPLLGGMLGGWLFYRYLRELLVLLRQPADLLLGGIGLLGAEIGKTVIVVALIFAILGGITAHLSFLVRHRMTKREVSDQTQR